MTDSKLPKLLEMCKHTGRSTRMLIDYINYEENVDHGVIFVTPGEEDLFRAKLAALTNTVFACEADIRSIDLEFAKQLISASSTEFTWAFIDHAALETMFARAFKEAHRWDNFLSLDN